MYRRPCRVQEVFIFVPAEDRCGLDSSFNESFFCLLFLVEIDESLSACYGVSYVFLPSSLSFSLLLPNNKNTQSMFSPSSLSSFLLSFFSSFLPASFTTEVIYLQNNKKKKVSDECKQFLRVSRTGGQRMVCAVQWRRICTESERTPRTHGEATSA